MVPSGRSVFLLENKDFQRSRDSIHRDGKDIFPSASMGVMARGLILHLPLDSRPKYYNYLEHNSIVSMFCHTSFKDWPNAILHIKLSHSHVPTSFFCILPQTSSYLKAAILFSLEIRNSLSIALQYHCLLLLFCISDLKQETRGSVFVHCCV